MGKSDFRVLCRVELTKSTAALLAQRIEEEYRVHLIMDNLPAATKMIREMPDGKAITMCAHSILTHLHANRSH